jgi:putative transferase (TIGR04331 family)
VQKNNVDVTIVGLDLGLYSAGHQSGPRSSLILEDFKQKVDFIESVSISLQNKVKVFPYPHPGWDSRDKYIDLFGEGIISGNKVFNDAIYNSKIIVCTYPQTTFSAAIYSNVPVILLYVKKYWELRPEFDELLLIMMEANIIFSDATLASRHISNIYSTPNEWWESDKVVKARKLFNEYCLRTSDDWLNEWGEFFAKELN